MLKNYLYLIFVLILISLPTRSAFSIDPSTLNDLPKELIVSEIASRMNLKDTASLALLNRRFYELLKSQLNTAHIQNNYEIKNHINEVIPYFMSVQLATLSNPRPVASLSYLISNSHFSDLYHNRLLHYQDGLIVNKRHLRFDSVQKIYQKDILSIRIHQGFLLYGDQIPSTVGLQGENGVLREPLSNHLWVVIEFKDYSIGCFHFLLEPSQIESLFQQTTPAIISYPYFRLNSSRSIELAYTHHSYAVLTDSRPLFNILGQRSMVWTNHLHGIVFMSEDLLEPQILFENSQLVKITPNHLSRSKRTMRELLEASKELQKQNILK